jgi:hypothetical protein
MKTLTQIDSCYATGNPGGIKGVPALLGQRSCRKGGLVKAVNELSVGPDAIIYLFGRHHANDIPTVYFLRRNTAASNH